jgi:hypothetical protein
MPELLPAKFFNIVLFTYLFDLVFILWYCSLDFVSSSITTNNLVMLSFYGVVVALIFKAALVRLDVVRLCLTAAQVNPKRFRTASKVGAWVLLIVAFASIRLSVAIVPVLMVFLLLLKASKIIESIIPEHNASPASLLNTAAKMMILLEFLPLAAARASAIPVMIATTSAVNGGALVLILGFFLGVTILRPSAERFISSCVKCHRPAHRIIILTLGSCTNCKRLELGKKRA